MKWNAAAVSDGLEFIGKHEKECLQYLKSILDEYHCEPRSLEYYQILCGDWLMNFLHLLYAATVESGEQEPTIFKNWFTVTSDSLDFGQEAIRSTRYFEELKENSTMMKNGGDVEGANFSRSTVQINKKCNKSIYEKALEIICTKKPKILIVDSYIRETPLRFLLATWKWRNWITWGSLSFQIHINFQIDEVWRKKKSIEIGRIENFEKLYKALIPMYLPALMLEGFAEYRAQLFNLNKFRPRILYSANALHGNWNFKMLLAEWKGKGTKLLYHQHGGGYGIDKINPSEEYELSIVDTFFTWGWKKNGKNNITPLTPAIRLYFGSRKAKGILLCCNNYPASIVRLQYHPQPGKIDFFYEETYEFIKIIKLRKHLTCRLSRYDYKSGFRESINNKFFKIKFDKSKTKPLQNYTKYELVVHNYLGTSYLETLGLNIPTVCFYDYDMYKFRDEAIPYINELERVGILHRSGANAAQFVNQLGNQIQDWWTQPDLQSVCSKFVSQYANFNSNWIVEWEEAFMRELVKVSE